MSEELTYEKIIDILKGQHEGDLRETDESRMITNWDRVAIKVNSKVKGLASAINPGEYITVSGYASAVRKHIQTQEK